MLLIYFSGIHSLSFNIAIVFPNAHILSKLLQTRLHGLILVIRSRLSEVAQFQSCGFWPDFHTGMAFLVTAGQMYLILKKKQNVSGRQGQLAAAGKSK